MPAVGTPKSPKSPRNGSTSPRSRKKKPSSVLTIPTNNLLSYNKAQAERSTVLGGSLAIKFQFPVTSLADRQLLSVGCFVLDQYGKLCDVITVEQPTSLLTVESVKSLQQIKTQRVAISSEENEDTSDSSDNVETTVISKKRAIEKTAPVDVPLIQSSYESLSLLTETDQRRIIGMNQNVKNVQNNRSSAVVGGFRLRSRVSRMTIDEASLSFGSMDLGSFSLDTQGSDIDDDLTEDKRLRFEQVTQTFTIQIRDWKISSTERPDSRAVSSGLSGEYAQNFLDFLNHFTLSSSKATNINTEKTNDHVSFCQKTAQRVMFSKMNQEKWNTMGSQLSRNPFGEAHKLVFFIEGDLHCLVGDISVQFENTVDTVCSSEQDNPYECADSSTKFLHHLNVSLHQPPLMWKHHIFSTPFSFNYNREKKEYVVELVDPLAESIGNKITCQPYTLPFDTNLFQLPKIVGEQGDCIYSPMLIRNNHSVVVESTGSNSNSSTSCALPVVGNILRFKLLEENQAIGIRPIKVNHYCILVDSQGSVVDIVSLDQVRSRHGLGDEPTVKNFLSQGLVGSTDTFMTSMDYFDINLESAKTVKYIFIASIIGNGYETSEIPKLGSNNTPANNTSSFLYFDSSIDVCYLNDHNEEVSLKKFPLEPNPNNCILWCKLSYSQQNFFNLKMIGEAMTLLKHINSQSVLTGLLGCIRSKHIKPSVIPPCPSIFETTLVTEDGETFSSLETPIPFSEESPIVLRFKGISHEMQHWTKNYTTLKLNVLSFDKGAYFLTKQTLELKREGSLRDGVIDPSAIIPKLVEKTHVMFCVVSIKESRFMEEIKTPSVDDDMSEISTASVTTKQEPVKNVSVMNPHTLQPLFTFPLSDVASMAQVVDENNQKCESDVYNKPKVDQNGYRHLLAFKLEKTNEPDMWTFGFLGEWMPSVVANGISGPSLQYQTDEQWIYYLVDTYLTNNETYKRENLERISLAPISVPSQYTCVGVKLEDNKNIPIRSDNCALLVKTSKKYAKHKAVIDSLSLKTSIVCHDWRGNIAINLSSENAMPESGSAIKWIGQDAKRFAAIVDRSTQKKETEWPMRGEHDEVQCYFSLDAIDSTSSHKFNSSKSMYKKKGSCYVFPTAKAIPYFSLLIKMHIDINSTEVTPEEIQDTLTQITAVVRIYNMETKHEEFHYSFPCSQIPINSATTKLTSHFYISSIKCLFTDEGNTKTWHYAPINSRKQAGELTKYLSPIPNTLKFTIEQGDKLPIMDTLTSSCDPFIIVYQIDEEDDLKQTKKKLKKIHKTKCIKKTLDPRWTNEVATM